MPVLFFVRLAHAYVILTCELTKKGIHMFRLICSIVFLLITTVGLHADVSVTHEFSNNMVLQREMPVPVWGTADAGENVTVAFAGQKVNGKADSDGKWMVKLKPLKTSVDPRTMTIKGKNTLTFENVLVGEVWLCSGQSNMGGSLKEMHLPILKKHWKEIDFKAFRWMNNKREGWTFIDDENHRQLSTVSYFFGIRLYKELNKDGIKVPIGLMPRAMSGSTIQSWVPTDVALAMKEEMNITWNPDKDQHHHQSGNMFNERIDSMIPYAIRGAVWYQGESNSNYQAWEYQFMLPRLIDTWRGLWAERSGEAYRKFPFYYVQVPPQSRNNHYSRIRDSMRRVLDTTENTGMAVFYDWGPAVHPPNKEPSGDRLAYWALAKDYGQDITFSGPLLKHVSIQGNKAVLSFDHVDGGLKSKDGGKSLKFFEIAAKDAKYVRAKASIAGDTVVVQSDSVSNPVYVRYLFNKIDTPREDYSPEMSLFNGGGLPASPFITDDIKPAPIDKAARRIAQAAAKKREKDAANAEKNKTGVKLK